MPYNPGIQDRRGEIYAAGIMQAAAGISRGIQDYRAKKQLADDEAAAVTFITKNGSRLGIDVSDPKEVKAVIKAAGGGREAVTMLADMAQLEEQRAQQKAERDRETRNARALAATLSGQGGNYLQPGTMSTDRSGTGLVRQFSAHGGELTPGVAQLLLGAGKSAAPQAGSAGFQTVNIPGLGDVVLDRATGEPLDSGKIVKPAGAPKSAAGGPEISADGKYQRSGPDDTWKPIDEKKNDAKSLTAQELARIEALGQTERDLQALEQVYNELGEDWGGPLGGRALALDPTDPNVARIDNLVNGAMPNLARGVFREVGVLTEPDAKRYLGLLPGKNDTAAQRKNKFNDLRARLKASKVETLNTLKAAGRDVEGLQDLFGTNPDASPEGRRKLAGITAVKTPAEFEALPPGAKFEFNGRFGTKR